MNGKDLAASGLVIPAKAGIALPGNAHRKFLNVDRSDTAVVSAIEAAAQVLLFRKHYTEMSMMPESPRTVLSEFAPLRDNARCNGAIPAFAGMTSMESEAQ